MNELLEKADLFIELGTKIKDFTSRIDVNKSESEMTENELKEFREFMGYLFLTMQEINN